MIETIKETANTIKAGAFDLKQRLQDKLRHDYDYKQTTNSGRGTILVKGDVWNNKNSYAITRKLEIDSRGNQYYPVIDMSFSIGTNPLENDILVTITEYADYGVDKSNNRFVKLKELKAGLSLEELKIITTLVNEIHKES